MKISQKKIIIVATLLTISIITLVILNLIREPKESEGIINTKIPSFSLTDLNDGTVNILEQAQGKVAIVVFCATWCPFCVADMEIYNSIQEEYANKVSVIAVNRSESKRTVERYIETLEFTPSMTIALDPNDEIFTQLEGYAMPEIVFIDETGKIKIRHRDRITEEEIRAALLTFGLESQSKSSATTDDQLDDSISEQ